MNDSDAGSRDPLVLGAAGQRQQSQSPTPAGRRIEPGKFPTGLHTCATAKAAQSQSYSVPRSIDRQVGQSVNKQHQRPNSQLAPPVFVNHRQAGETCDRRASLDMAMTATSTRSTRRAEGSLAHPHSLSLPHTEKHRATRHHHLQLQHQQSNSSRPLKRLHEATNLAYDLKPAKKTKFEIEIPSKSQYQARLYPENIDSRQQQQPPPPQPLAQAQAQTHAQHSHHRPARVVSVSAPHDKPPKHDVRQAATATRAAVPIPEPAHAAPPPPAQKASAPPALPAETATTLKDKAVASVASASGAPTKHREKVVNGIKHELDRLQPSSADMASNSQGRKLRSQEGVRYKSELSAYFPEYDEVIGNVPKEHRMYSFLFLFFFLFGPRLCRSPGFNLPQCS